MFWVILWPFGVYFKPFLWLGGYGSQGAYNSNGSGGYAGGYGGPGYGQR